MSPEPPAEDLAAAVAGREHWHLDGRAAVYTPPDSQSQVRVQPMAVPDRRARYVASIVRGGVARHARPCYDAAEAVRWAEQVPLD